MIVILNEDVYKSHARFFFLNQNPVYIELIKSTMRLEVPIQGIVSILLGGVWRTDDRQFSTIANVDFS